MRKADVSRLNDLATDDQRATDNARQVTILMSGSFDYEPYPTQLAMDATAIGVFLYDDTQNAGDRYTLLPNIRCEQIQYKEGAASPSARFRYILDELAAASGWPDQFDQIWPLTVVAQRAAPTGALAG